LKRCEGRDDARKALAFARDVAQEAGIATKGYRVVVNTNPDGGQTVFSPPSARFGWQTDEMAAWLALPPKGNAAKFVVS